MRQLDSNLLFKIQAQTSAAIAQPTFVTDIDFSKINTSPTPTSSVSPTATASPTNSPTTSPSPTISPTTSPTTQVNCISLKSTQVNVAQGAQFNITVGLNSGTAKLKSYTVKIQFNNTLLQVVDADTQTTGTQVTFLDTSFTPTTNSVQNNTGVVIIKGDTTTATVLAKDVAQLKFTAIGEGSAQIAVVKTESSLVDDSSANILQCATTLTIGTGSQAGNSSEIEDQPLPANPISGLPKSDLPFGGVIYLLLGILLIYLGSIGRRIARKKKQSR